MLLIVSLIVGYFIIVNYIDYKEKLKRNSIKTCGECIHCKYKMEYKDYILDGGADRSSSFIKDWYECDYKDRSIRKNQPACENLKIK